MTPASVFASPARSMRVSALLTSVEPVLGLLEDLDNYEGMDMLALAEKTPRPLLVVMVRLMGDASTGDAVGIDEGNNVKCVLAAAL